MLNFEKVRVKNVEEYEELVIKRLTQMQKEDPNRFVYWHEVNGIDLDNLLHYRSHTAEELLLEIENMEGYFEYYDLEVMLKELLEQTGVEIELTDEIRSSYDHDDFINELVAEFITVDSNAEEVFKNTDLKINLFPMQEENMDTEGASLEVAIESLIKLYINSGYLGYYYLPNSVKELEKTINNCEVLKKLFISQGYKLKDIEDKAKLDNSPFLNTFYKEICNDTRYPSTFLTILVRISVWDFINNFTDPRKRIVIEPGKNLCLGLFNPIHGSGSSLEMVLEKPFSFEVDRVNLQIEGALHNNGFTVSEVYDLVGECWSKNIRFEEAKEPKNPEFLQKEYERFKLQWMIDHGYTLTDLINVLDEITMDNDVSSALNEFEQDLGFNQNLYPCYEEWLNNEKREEEE